ncbi:bifunctional helix-turn-helix transcriptional regulator/GNAT family N-acetyltransferase [Pseudomonas chlororaphis]|uniref:bifunctional helix-turn-helix transcriptional regulator/GNAT family N-acetyltransferase n=1 Tax=Pseudomonas chlororaphis TaxID=587753 RepID=UPI000F552C2F|nr:bifunctional helix-turn-helix transcriptional regulator/GNAT family N-acetyltransferase [Pseudomonas chlororaphis]AZD48886.1 Transcriptional regulator, MarR family [Pseudomonas chlororaphis subsp. aurantiaca]
MSSPSPLVDQVRNESRKLVRELGFMGATLAGSDLAPSAVHALIELDLYAPLTAAQLGKSLNLEKSSVSRLLAKLIERGDIQESPSPSDAREKLLGLTASGRKQVAAIHAFGSAQVQQALRLLAPREQSQVVAGLRSYGQALQACRLGHAQIATTIPTLQRGYRPGMIGRITELHAHYYSRLVGFGQFFEQRVAAGLAEFSERLDHPDNGIWLAVLDEQIVGSIAIDLGGAPDHKQADKSAHLRWFILDEAARGTGTGRLLLKTALEHCDRAGATSCYLWTFSGLDAARHLYEAFGFQLVEEQPAAQWGKTVLEQRFERRHPGLD